METSTSREVTEADVATALVEPIDPKKPLVWVKLGKYEALYFLTGRMTEDELHECFRQLTRWWRLPERCFHEGVAWLRERHDSFFPAITILLTPDGRRVYRSSISMKTGKPYEKTGPRTKTGPRKITRDRNQRDVEFPAVTGGDPRLSRFFEELRELRMNGEPVEEWWGGDKNDALRIAAAFRTEYVTRGVGPLGSAQVVGVPGFVGKLVKEIFMVDIGGEVEESAEA